MVAKTLIIAGAVLLAAFAAVAPAAARQPAPPVQAGLDGSALLRMFDKNGDGFLDKSEVDALAAAAFARADATNDGKLSPQELRTAIRNLANRAGGRNRPGTQGRRFGSRPTPRFQGNLPGYGRRFGGPNGYGPRFQGNAPGSRQSPRFQPRFQPPQGDAPGFGRRFQTPGNGRNLKPRNGLGPHAGRADVRHRHHHHHHHGKGKPQAQGQPNAGPQAAPSTPANPPAPSNAPAPQGGADNSAPAATPGSLPVPRAGGRLPNFQAIDANGDGVITPDEFAAAARLGNG